MELVPDRVKMAQAFKMVRERRLELLYLSVPDPKSGASASSATLALMPARIQCFMLDVGVDTTIN